MRRVFLLLLLTWWGCNGPPPPPLPPPVCPDGQIWDGSKCVCPAGTEWVESEGACLPPRVDAPPDPTRIKGITAFALSLHSREYITEAANYAKSKGINTLRVGFEIWRWEDWGYLRHGPKYDSVENLRNVWRMLDATARVEGIWVELIPVFTIKGLNNPDTPEMRRKAVELAAKLIEDNDFKHVYLSYANEWSHSGGVGPRIHRDEVVWGLRRLKQTGRLVTTDCGGDMVDGNWDPGYYEDFLPWVDMVAFHPPRNPEPPLGPLRRAYRRYVERDGKLAVLFNETVAFASDLELELFPVLKQNFRIANNGRPPESRRKQIVTQFLGRISEALGRPFYHCTSCFMWRDDFEEFWIPEM